MIECEKLLVIDELARKYEFEYPGRHIFITLSSCKKWFTLGITEPGKTLDDWDFNTIDKLIDYLQELSYPSLRVSPKFKVGQKLWALSSRIEVPFDSFICDERIWDKEGTQWLYREKNSYYFTSESLIYDNKVALIEDQVRYWMKCLKDEEE